MLPAELHLEAKHTCEVGLSLSALNLAVQPVAQHEREATSDDLRSSHQNSQQRCSWQQDLHPPTGRPGTT